MLSSDDCGKSRKSPTTVITTSCTENDEEKLLQISDVKYSDKLIYDEDFSLDEDDKGNGIDDIIANLNKANDSLEHGSKEKSDEIKVVIKKKLPVKVPCSKCKKLVITKVKPEASARSWCYFWLMCFFLLWCCAPCVLYSEKLQDYNHHCKECDQLISTYKPYKEKTAVGSEKVKVDIKRNESSGKKKKK